MDSLQLLKSMRNRSIEQNIREDLQYFPSSDNQTIHIVFGVANKIELKSRNGFRFSIFQQKLIGQALYAVFLRVGLNSA